MKSVRPALPRLGASPDSTSSARSSVRTCVGCRATADRSDLLRLVVRVNGADHQVVPDPRRRMPGRGANMHPDPGCLALALRRKAFGRALRVSAPLDTSEVEAYVAGLAAPSSRA